MGRIGSTRTFFEQELQGCDPKDGDLFLIKVKPKEILVEA